MSAGIMLGPLYEPNNAHATGGAYTSTKHGGGTVDGISFSGVNRGVNPDYAPGGTYYPANTEAGLYSAGECSHCHEAHASFGGTEPPPNLVGDAGPDAYLAMKEYGGAANYSNLCWYCHDNIAGGGGPGTGYYNFYQGNAKYNGSSHLLNLDGGLAMSWPGGTAGAPGVGATTDAVATWPRKGRTALATGNNGSCVNCHTPHGIKGNYDATGVAPTATNYLTGGTALSTDLIPRQLIAREEALCLNCHDADGPAATDIKTQIDRWGYVAPTQWIGATEGSGHPSREAAYYGRHNLAGPDGLASTTADNEPPTYTAAGGWFTSTTKHAECIDCHNPHTAQGRGSGLGAAPYYGNVFQWSIGTNNALGVWNTNRNAGAASNVPVKLSSGNRGVWGVSVTTSTGAISGIVSSLQSWNDAAPNSVYDLCLKCHSYWAWGAVNGNTAAGAAALPLWNSPSSARTWLNTTSALNPRSNLSMTNQSWEFATDGIAPTTAASAPTGRVAYHPVFGQGRHRPELYIQRFTGAPAGPGTRNPCWCATTTCPPTALSYYTSATVGQGGYGNGTCADNGGTGPRAGTRTDLTGADVATLSQNFVPPWRHTSMVTCTDCHEDSSETTPRGPHGSARPYALRKLDTTISYNRTGALAMNYSALPVNASNNLCINCHRADVYGWDYNGAPTFTIYPNFARQPHDRLESAQWRTHYATGTTQCGGSPCYAPNGIVCMRCHGGSRDRLGYIHGNDFTATTTTCPNCTNSGRLIAASGAASGSGEWISWVKSRVGTAGSCAKGATSPYCSDTATGTFNSGGAMYDY